MTNQFPISEINKVKRVPKRGAYDHESVFSIIDAAWIAHVGIQNSQTSGPTVIPMLHARIDDTVIFHGANSSRLIKYLASGSPVCLAFSIEDGLVLAKSLFHHSMNYRSAVAFGTGCLVSDPDETTAAFKAISDKVMPGRWDDARQPNPKELSATAVVKVKIKTASAKIRTGDPVDEPEDINLPIWSGVLPFHSQTDAPIPDGNSSGIEIPEYIREFAKGYNAN